VNRWLAEFQVHNHKSKTLKKLFDDIYSDVYVYQSMLKTSFTTMHKINYPRR